MKLSWEINAIKFYRNYSLFLSNNSFPVHNRLKSKPEKLGSGKS